MQKSCSKLLLGQPKAKRKTLIPEMKGIMEYSSLKGYWNWNNRQPQPK